MGKAKFDYEKRELREKASGQDCGSLIAPYSFMLFKLALTGCLRKIAARGDAELAEILSGCYLCNMFAYDFRHPATRQRKKFSVTSLRTISLSNQIIPHRVSAPPRENSLFLSVLLLSRFSRFS